LERALYETGEGHAPRRNAMVQQFTVRLSAAKAERLRAMLDEIGEFVAENEDPAASEMVSLTMVLGRIRRPSGG
ncbi:MAG: hypothetical protein GTO22_03635, partial [Gemmatimonadales bacterium]|nr:hypothetical protein [Gemmatimonadales bacterium]